MLAHARRILRLLKAARLALVVVIAAEATVVVLAATGRLHWGWGVFAAFASIPSAAGLVAVHGVLRSRLRVWVESLGRAQDAAKDAGRTPDTSTHQDVIDAAWRERP